MSKKSPDFWVKYISFAWPPLGWIIYAATSKTYPETAALALKWTKFGMRVIGVFFIFVLFIAAVIATVMVFLK